MRKRNKIIISVVSSVILLFLGIFLYYKLFYNVNKLNLAEKEWINDHKNSVISINLPNDLNIFSKSGKGIFYEFLDAFEKEYDITLNKNIIDIGQEDGLGFVISSKMDNNDLLFYHDHYVLISKERTDIKSPTDLNGKTIGALSNEVSKINSRYSFSTNYTTAQNRSDLLQALKNDTVSYILVPLNEYIDEVLTNDYKIVYHFDDLTNNYYINLSDDSTLNSIITKFYNTWKDKYFEESFNRNSYDLFIEKLEISQVEADTLTDKTFNYGFISYAPYQTLSGSKYGGIILAYLDDFCKFANVDIAYTKYKNENELIKAFNNSKVDLVLNDSSFDLSQPEIKTNLVNSFYIVGPKKNGYKVASLDDLNDTVYVLKDSKLARKLSSASNIELKFVKNERELLRKARHNKLIAISTEGYEYLKNKDIKNYQVVFNGYDSNYSFRYQNDNDTFYKMFNKYITYRSSYDITNIGILSYSRAESNGNFISTLAKYILLVIAIVVVVVGVVIYSKKTIKLNTRIKKDDKLKFIDMLTSLKNRNYLNERISVWNQNTIYPQAIIVIDLNNIKYLNDTFGHEEGDKQIMAAANILHQTQLDNTEIMRTDGNEFMVYLVGYNEKQVVNYLKKLVKEFSTLPYEYGAAFGFSMIVDDLKLIDDAINEATIQMRENKEIEYESSDKED